MTFNVRMHCHVELKMSIMNVGYIELHRSMNRYLA